jgi:hypothetical protein
LDVCDDSRGMRYRKFNRSKDMADADRPLNEAATLEAAKQFYDSAEYQPILKHRLAST